MQKILVVDDDVHLRTLVRTYAEVDGYACVEAGSGDAAIEIAETEDFDLIVLDVMMPGRDGFETLSELRKLCNTPVIMLTARAEEYDRLLAFNLGSDDYVPKPFSPKELMARVKAILKRSTGIREGRLTFGALSIAAQSRAVTLDGREVTLTPKEFDLLLYMAKHNRIVLDREQLLRKVWGFDYYGDARTVDTHVKSLRERLGEYRKVIATVWGVGYKFDYREEEPR